MSGRSIKIVKAWCGQHAMAAGVTGWLLFCVAAVLIGGVRWDESYEHAQVLTRDVAYPDGHPLFVYVRNAFSIQTYVSALILFAGAGPGLLCGFRNVLFLAATVIPVFLTTLHLTRRYVWTIAAVLLTLSGIYVSFDGSYPIAVWPNLYSNGHIGGGCVLLALWAFISGRSRTGFFLTGLLPCLHIGQGPVLFVLAILYLLHETRAGCRDKTLRDAVWLVAGITVSGGFYLVMKQLSVEPAQTGAYAVSGADTWAIWRGYTQWYDPHRVFPPVNGHLALAGMLLLGGMAAWLECRGRAGAPSEGQRPFLVLFVYTVGAAAAVWGVMAIHRAMGADIPFLLIAWMPYRLINHVPPLLLVVVVGVLAGPPGGRRDHAYRGLTLLGLALCAAVFRPWLSHVFPPWCYTRYVADGAAVYFALYGAASAVALERVAGLEQRKALRAALCAGAFIALLLLALCHQFGACCVLAGAVAASLPLPRAAFASTAWLRSGARTALAVICIAGVMLSLGRLWTHRSHLRIEPDEERIAHYLASQTDRAPGHPAGNPMIATSPFSFMLQAKTGSPVFTEAATASLISYMPELAGVIQRMYRDVYGIRFDEPPGEQPFCGWRELWSKRTRAQWHALSNEYGFRFVLLADDGKDGTAPCNLPLVLDAGRTKLYEVQDPAHSTSVSATSSP